MSRPPPRPSSRPLIPRAHRVVIIEDDDDTRALLHEWIVQTGCAVRSFSDASDALAAIAEQLPDVVVTDLNLCGMNVSEMNGVELAASLRADAATCHIALIAITGAVDPEWDNVRFFDAYLRKPIDYDVLPDIVSQLADSARRERPTIIGPAFDGG